MVPAEMPRRGPQGGRPHRRELRAGALHGAVHGRRRRQPARRRHRESGRADALDQGRAGQRDLRRRAGLRLAGRRHHGDGRRHAHAGQLVRLGADAGDRRADRVHHAPRRLRRAGRPHGPRAHARRRARGRTRSRGAAGRPAIPGPRTCRPAHERGPRAPRRVALAFPARVRSTSCCPPTATTRPSNSRWTRFGDILDELVGRTRDAAPAGDRRRRRLAGAVARRMVDACRPHADRFITPMAAVAGAVADEIMDAMRAARPQRAYVNNGGDIALHLAPQTRFASDWSRTCRATGRSIRWTAVSNSTRRCRCAASPRAGWRGRSFSLGIADSVTVLAADAAAADAAATMIANEVDARPRGHRAAPRECARRRYRSWRAPRHGGRGDAARGDGGSRACARRRACGRAARTRPHLGRGTRAPVPAPVGRPARRAARG